MRFPSRLFAAGLLPALICSCGAGEEPGVVEKAAAAAVRGVDRAKVERTIGHLEAIRFSLERYRLDHGAYPEGTSFETLRTALTPTYAPRVESHDAWGNPFSYISDGATCSVTSPGEDGNAGTPDDVTLSDSVVIPPASFVP